MARGYASGVLTGVVVSVAAAALAPMWRPTLSRWARPAMKSAIKQGMVAYETMRGRTAEVGESVSDLLAEAQLELMTERSAEEEASISRTMAAD